MSKPIIAPGAEVSIGGSIPLPAVVIAIRIEEGLRILYEVAWWVDGERCTDWLEPFEVVAEDDALKLVIEA